MADNIDITPGSGATYAADEVTDGTLGTVKAGYTKIMDGTLNGTNKLVVNASGEAKVKATDTDALLATIDTDTGNIATNTTDLPNVIGTDGAAGPSKAVSVAGTDGSGNLQELTTDTDGHLQVDVLSGGGGGTQYTEGDTDASITGTAMLWEDTSDTLRPVSAAKPLPVDLQDASVAVTKSGTWTLDANSGTDIGDVTINNASGASAVHIQDGGNSITVDNGGTFATQVDGAALTALQLIDDTVFTDDAAFTVATSKVTAQGMLVDETSTDTADEGDVAAPRITTNRQQIVTIRPNASGEGLDIYRSIDIDETEEEIKASAGKIYGWYFYNLASATRYIKFYNATAANTTVGTTTPIMTIPLATGVGANVEFTNGIPFSTALCVAATTGVADSDTGAPGANEIVGNILYK